MGPAGRWCGGCARRLWRGGESSSSSRANRRSMDQALWVEPGRAAPCALTYKKTNLCIRRGGRQGAGRRNSKGTMSLTHPLPSR